MTANRLIDLTIEEIVKNYQPGTLPWMKVNRPGDWKRMVDLETMINQKALTGETEGLKRVLNDYRDLLQELIKAYSPKRERVTLFDALKKGDEIDGEKNHSDL